MNYPKLAQSTSSTRIKKLISKLDSRKTDSVFLDLGCGSGLVCDELSKRNFSNVFGCDKVPIQEFNLRKWKFFRLNFDDNNWGNIVKTQLGKRAQIITAFDILEHLKNPVDFLLQIRSIMDPNSELFLSTPNTQSWERFCFPNSWSGASDPEHYILYNAYSLQFLLKKCGFEIIQIEAPIEKLGIINRFIPKLGGQFLVQIRISAPFQIDP